MKEVIKAYDKIETEERLRKERRKAEMNGEKAAFDEPLSPVMPDQPSVNG